MKLAASNPLRSALLSVLIFEIVVFWLAFAGMVQVAGRSVPVAASWTTVASLLAVLGILGLWRGWGYWFGWLTQLAGIGLGILTPWMYAMGIIFALIWIMSFVLGKRLEAHQARNHS